MDTIEFKFTKFKYGADGFESDVVDIFVNGKNLLNAIHNYEKRYVEDGGHVPITPYELYRSLARDYVESSVPIYGCGCGEVDCCPVYISVNIEGDTVIWHRFIFPDENFGTKKISRPSFGKFVFDKKQYFDAVGTLRDWLLNKAFNITYGGIDCGYISLIFKDREKSYDMGFDEMTCDPLPALVEFYNYVQKCIAFDKKFSNKPNSSIGYKFETIVEDYEPELKISAEHQHYQITATFELRNNRVTFRQTYKCFLWAELLKKLFSDLVNDKYFPYSYPCFWYLCEDVGDEVFDKFDDEVDKLYPDWNEGDKLNYGVEQGILSLSARNKIFAEKYKKMLTNYVVPEKWFEE